MLIYSEGFAVDDIECATCRQAVANTTARGELLDLLGVGVSYGEPHLMWDETCRSARRAGSTAAADR